MYKTVWGVLLGMYSVVLLLMLYLTLKFVRLYMSSKRCLVCFLVMLNLVIFSRMLFFLFELLYREIEDWAEPIPLPIEGTFGWVSQVFFASAVVCNISNWWVLTMKLSQSEKTNKIYIWIFRIVSQGILLTYYISIVLTSWVKSLRLSYPWHVFGTIYGIIFLALGSIYAIVGIRFYIKLKAKLTDKFKQLKWRILASVIIISTCFLVRGAFNLYRYNSNFDIHAQYSLKEDTAFYPIFTLLYYLSKWFY